MSFKGAIFDLDGVIVNTVPIHFKAWKKMFEEYGHSFTFDDYKAKVDGIPRLDGARAILTELPDKELKEASAKKQRYFLDYLGEEKIQVYPGTLNLIKELRGHKIKIAVISSSKNCPVILEKADMYKYIDAAISGNDITQGKPDPQIFLMAKDRLSLEISECIVFEDAELGVEAAKRGGFKTVGINRYEDPHRLNQADIVVKDLGELSYSQLENQIK